MSDETPTTSLLSGLPGVEPIDPAVAELARHMIQALKLTQDGAQTAIATSKPSKTKKEIAAEEDYAAMTVAPAFYVDDWYVITWKGHLRLALGERFEKTEYRTAIVLDLEDAERLANRILSAVERRKEKDAEVIQNSEDPEN